MKDNQDLTRTHQRALDAISEILIELQDKTVELGEIPRRFDDWEHDTDRDVIWWDTSMTGGEIAEPPGYVGSPASSDWPFEVDDQPHLLWVPLPKLARSRP